MFAISTAWRDSKEAVVSQIQMAEARWVDVRGGVCLTWEACGRKRVALSGLSLARRLSGSDPLQLHAQRLRSRQRHMHRNSGLLSSVYCFPNEYTSCMTFYLRVMAISARRVGLK